MLPKPIRLLASLTLGSALAAFACGGSADDVADGNSASPSEPGGGGTSAPDAGSASSSGTQPGTSSDGGGTSTAGHAIKTVFVIMMENHSWDTVSKSGSADYINKTLVPMGAHAEAYYTPPGNHPSEPNYIWLEAGDNLGITTDDDPDKNHQSTKDHLVTQLENAGITWKAYVEDIDGSSCPLTSSGKFGAKHTPQLFFDDVTDTNNPDSKKCKDHVVPYSKLGDDLKADTVARYNFITPNLCDDMHGELGFSCPFNPFGDSQIQHGDDWLKAEMPKILESNAYKNGGVVFIIWDEGDEPIGGTASDGPLPFLVISPLAKKNYKSTTKYNHSSTLRTLETIFGVPFLRGAQKANDLSEMFTSFP